MEADPISEHMQNADEVIEEIEWENEEIQSGYNCSDFRGNQRRLVFHYLDWTELSQDEKWKMAGKWMRQYPAKVVFGAIKELHLQGLLEDHKDHAIPYLTACFEKFDNELEQEGHHEHKYHKNTKYSGFCRLMVRDDCTCTDPEPIYHDGELILAVEGESHTWI